MNKLKSVKPKKKPDYKKVNKTRRSRGYNFEYSLVNAFNNHISGEWNARRLGGSSSGLPDVVVTNNTKSILYSIECKSGQGNTLYIPKDQVERCFEITNKFLSSYVNKHVSFAFKFKGNKKRKLQYRIIQDITVTPILLKSIQSVSYNIVRDVLTIHFNESEYQYKHKDEFFHKECKFLESIEEFVNWL